MVRNLLRAASALMLLLCTQPALAISEGISVTQETQAKLGLEFTLMAVRLSEKAIGVRIEIPRKGKLEHFKRARLRITQGQSLLLSSNLEMKPGENGSLVARFQIAPELADKCSIDLVVANVPATPRDYESYYAVKLNGYVTDRK